MKDPKKHNGDWKVVQKVNHRHLFDRALFQMNDDFGDDLLDQPRTEEALQQDISVPWKIPINSICIDLGTLARLPVPGENTTVDHNENNTDEEVED